MRVHPRCAVCACVSAAQYEIQHCNIHHCAEYAVALYRNIQNTQAPRLQSFASHSRTNATIWVNSFSTIGPGPDKRVILRTRDHTKTP